MDDLDVRMIASRLNGIDYVDVKNIQTFDDGVSYDFRIRSPPGVDTPRAERGPTTLRSVAVFDNDLRLKELTLRFPPLRLSDYPGKSNPGRKFRQMIAREVTPEPIPSQPQPVRVVRMVKTGVPHYKLKRRREKRGEPFEDVVDLIDQLIKAFNDEFY